MSTTNSDKLILSADSDALSIDRWFQLANNILVSKEPDVLPNVHQPGRRQEERRRAHCHR